VPTIRLFRVAPRCQTVETTKRLSIGAVTSACAALALFAAVPVGSALAAPITPAGKGDITVTVPSTPAPQGKYYSGHDNGLQEGVIGTLSFVVDKHALSLDYFSKCGEFTTGRVAIRTGGLFHYQRTFSNGAELNLTGQLKSQRMAGHIQSHCRKLLHHTLRWSASRSK